MRAYLKRGAIRLLLALATVLAVTRGGPVHAVVLPVDPDAATPPPREHRPHQRPAGEDEGQVRPHGKHHRETAESRGVTPAGPSQTGQSELRGHKAGRVAVVPAVPKPVPVAPAPSVAPVPPVAKEAPKDTGEPPPKIPRFAALKTDETNMRKGPGQRYPIEWVYQRHDLPVEVEREYDVWRYVRDPDGVEGWVHQVTLSDRRTFVIQGKDAMLRADAKDTATAVANLKVGVIGRLRECDEGSQWCQVQVAGYKGYLRRDQFWGLLPDEVLSPS
jgi:SH3-like domain-containing protein